VIRSLPEDFQVTEIPAYPPDGGEGHLFLELTKRGWNTDTALQEVARQLGLPRGEIGVAGQKDRHALTRQWISLPAAAGPRLERFEHPDLQLGPPQPHSHKLRRGHLKANRFRIVVRELDGSPESALDAVRTSSAALLAQGGMGHLFGPQRFGWQGRNVEVGLRLLSQPRRIRPGDFALSALQSALFNLVWVLRRERGQLDTVLEGDVLQKTATGGLFYSADPAEDQARLEAGELRLTGPIFGADRLTPPPGSPAAALEDEALAAFGTPRELWVSLGKRAPGTRRALRTLPGDLELGVDGQSLVLEFTLESGAFATRLLGEWLAWREADARPDREEER
jgi:tRNA pseudouridine13 synthase